ncbi:hypothetical protein AGLY_004473, partial [Aphis glycines]
SNVRIIYMKCANRKEIYLYLLYINILIKSVQLITEVSSNNTASSFNFERRKIRNLNLVGQNDINDNHQDIKNASQQRTNVSIPSNNEWDQSCYRRNQKNNYIKPACDNVCMRNVAYNSWNKTKKVITTAIIRGVISDLKHKRIIQKISTEENNNQIIITTKYSRIGMNLFNLLDIIYLSFFKFNKHEK